GGVVMVSSLQSCFGPPSPAGVRGRRPLRKTEQPGSGRAGLSGYMGTASAKPQGMSPDRTRLLSFRLLPGVTGPADLFLDLFLDLFDVRLGFIAVHFDPGPLPSVPRVAGPFKGKPAAVEPQGGHGPDEQDQDDKQVAHDSLSSIGRGA